MGITEHQMDQAAYSALDAIFKALPKEAHTAAEIRCVLEKADDFLNYLRLEYGASPENPKERDDEKTFTLSAWPGCGSRNLRLAVGGEGTDYQGTVVGGKKVDKKARYMTLGIITGTVAAKLISVLVHMLLTTM